MTDLIAKLRAAIDEDERVAREAFYHPRRYDPAIGDHVIVGTDDGGWKASGCEIESLHPQRVPGEGFRDAIRIYDEGGHTEEQANHIVRHDPARVLRQVAAHRKILDDAIAQRHTVIEDDCWYTCPAATEERDGGTTCDETAGSTCGCGRDARVQRTVAALAEAYGIEP